MARWTIQFGISRFFPFWALNSEARCMVSGWKFRVQTSNSEPVSASDSWSTSGNVDQNEIQNGSMDYELPHRFSRFTCSPSYGRSAALWNPRSGIDHSENHMAYLGLRGRLESSKWLGLWPQINVTDTTCFYVLLVRSLTAWGYLLRTGVQSCCSR